MWDDGPIPGPSQLALRATGLSPLGRPWARPTTCGLCGAAIAAGDIAQETRFSYNFTNYSELAASTGIACGACSRVISAPVLRRLQMVVITETAVYPLTKDAYRAWFFLTPPAPPYVAVVRDAQLQHLIWRTPVTLDNRLQILRFGDRLLRIRGEVLRAALAAARRVGEGLSAASPKAHWSGPLPHPFCRLDRALASLAHGRFRPEIAVLGVAYADDLALLAHLGVGELWAMAYLAKRCAPVPSQPPPMDFTDLRKDI